MLIWHCKKNTDLHQILSTAGCWRCENAISAALMLHRRWNEVEKTLSSEQLTKLWKFQFWKQANSNNLCPTFGCILSLLIFQAQKLSNCTDNGYLVRATPHAVLYIVRIRFRSINKSSGDFKRSRFHRPDLAKCEYSHKREHSRKNRQNCNLMILVFWLPDDLKGPLKKEVCLSPGYYL